MRPLRVLYLIQGLDIGNQSGGAQLHAIRIACLLNRSEFTPAVFCMWQFNTETEQKWLETLYQKNILVFGLISPDGSLVHNIWRVLRELWKMTRTFAPDIIHSHSEREDWMNILIRLFHPKHPLAMRTIHIDQQWKTQPILGPIINNLIFPFTFNFETAVSQTIFGILSTRFRKKEKIVICYNGIDESAFNNKQSISQEVKLPKLINELPCIGIVGRLTKQKGHTDLLEAMKIIHQTHPTHLLIIGGGPLEDSLKDQAEQLGLESFVHFLGIRGDVDAILPHLDLFVLPSLWEGFPTVLLEAMSKEVPIIATDVSGSCELIQNKETGLLVPPNDPQRLAKAITIMLKYPAEAHAMAQRAKQFAKQYTIQNTTSCYTNIYKQIVNNNQRAFKKWMSADSPMKS